MAFDEYKSHGTVNAEQITEARSVITPQGAVTGQAGQWEVRYPDGDVRVLDDEAFQGEWGSGSDEPEEEQPTAQTTMRRSGDPTAEKSLTTQQRADAVSDSGTRDRTHPDTTDDADSESDTSRDSDEKETKSTRAKSRAKEQDDTEPPV